MTDPIQPAGEPYVYSVEEVEQMTPNARAELVARISQYLAQINPYVPMLPNPDGVAKVARTFAELVQTQKRESNAQAWDEGWAARRDTEEPTDGIPSFPLNPYRSES